MFGTSDGTWCWLWSLNPECILIHSRDFSSAREQIQGLIQARSELCHLSLNYLPLAKLLRCSLQQLYQTLLAPREHPLSCSMPAGLVLPIPSQSPTPGVPHGLGISQICLRFLQCCPFGSFFPLVILERGGPHMPIPDFTQAAYGIRYGQPESLVYTLCLCQDLVACLLAGTAPLRQRILDTL